MFQHFDADGNDRLEALKPLSRMKVIDLTQGHELAALLEHCGITALDQAGLPCRLHVKK